MSKSPWGNIGAWAAEAEREEQEEREEAAKAAAEAAARGVSSGAGAGGDTQNYPSLKDSVTTASKQKKKTKMTLQEFTLQNAYGSGSAQSRLTPEEMLRLPTRPKDRSAGDDMQYGGGGGRLGGGFSYTNRPGPGRMRDSDSGDGSWGGGPRRSYGGFEDDRRRGPPPGRVSDSDSISRADEVDNWATMKKPLPSYNSGPAPVGGPGRPSRYASLGGGSGGFSRADEVDNWASIKKPVPPPAGRSSSFGSGFRDSRPDPDRWTREVTQDRQRLVLDQPKGGEDGEEVAVKVNKPNPFGAARPREEVLAEKGLDWKKLESDIEAKKVLSRPTSSHSSRPGSSQSARSDGQALQGIADAVKPRPKVNPFGDAKPREVLLQEKGVDWRKVDLELEHRRVERPDSEEEKNLKEEIEQLKKESTEHSGESQSSILEQLHQKERDLELLIRELDDKVRFAPKPVERPGSGAGRFAGHTERPPSQPTGYHDARGGEFTDRPRSRGTGDYHSRPMDDRRTYHGGRGRGFMSNRDVDRSTSRDRW
ncbi:OLC1v1028442C1 [Oldenlandia corymbosa var. corymbosa]|uniref:OLC1v1028442C1 n=1 Tax=Oldenlandia corymbosa var. corymbosa TaxID=529605 RepID=A0AAV1CBR6_OLDCO|nr:OLC1v1028442C1 [Oldenlandia corymbosa var. corymbosa]